MNRNQLSVIMRIQTSMHNWKCEDLAAYNCNNVYYNSVQGGNVFITSVDNIVINIQSECVYVPVCQWLIGIQLT